jgi:hypothetical protein
MRLREPVVAAVEEFDQMGDSEPVEVVEGSLPVIGGGDADTPAVASASRNCVRTRAGSPSGARVPMGAER